jgi:hypothetical protein
VAAAPRAPKIVCRSSQLAWLAGTTEICGSGAGMGAILQVETAGQRLALKFDCPNGVLGGLEPPPLEVLRQHG